MLRCNQEKSESCPLRPMQHRGTPVFCPRSVGFRFCTRCGLNMDWLPLHSACPKCGFMNRAERFTVPCQNSQALSSRRFDSWMESLGQSESLQRRSSIGSIRSASLATNQCPLCQLRGGRCPDCKKRNSLEQNSTNQSSTSDSEIQARRALVRPKTRPSLRDRFGGFPKKIDKSARLSELFKVYGDSSSTQPDQSKRRTTRSSIVSLDVENILRKANTQTEMTISEGVKSTELPKVNPEQKYCESDKIKTMNAKEIRKNQRSLLQRIKKQNRGKYSYHYGNRYPGIVIGHRECIHHGSFVPPHMGWMWNVKTLGIGKIRKGWRPGAVRKPIKELMQHFLVSYPLDNVPVSKRGKYLNRKTEHSEKSLKQKPTLQIVKKNGEYCIVMNPLKDSESLKTAQDPYLPCEPIRFKLAKDAKVGKLYQLRQALKIKGFALCECTELDICEHRSTKEKKLFLKELKKLVKCLGLPKSTQLKDVPIDSESEMELEFTPPSAMLKSGARKPDVVCTETQYSVDDYKVQVSVDKFSCKPGREDSLNLRKKAIIGKFSRGMTQGDSKDTRAEGPKTVRIGVAGNNKDGTRKGKTAREGSGDNASAAKRNDAMKRAGVAGSTSSKPGSTIKNKVDKNHPDGNQGPATKESSKMSKPSLSIRVSNGCGVQSSNVCYPVQCTQMTPCFNPCFTGC